MEAAKGTDSQSNETADSWVPSLDTLEEDRERFKSVVVDALTPYLSTESDVDELRLMAYAINEANDRLQLQPISGSYTNFAYKISLKNNPEVRLFSKLCFPFAFWNLSSDSNGPSFDLERTRNEYTILRRLVSDMGDAPVATPYLCIDVKGHQFPMKLLVVQWSEAGTPWAEQFVTGKVDERIPPKLATALASLHSMPFDLDWNKNVRKYIESAIGDIQQRLIDLTSRKDDADRTHLYAANEIGLKRMEGLADGFEADFFAQDCLVHNDIHSFNILVESCSGEEFGPNGSLALCDWEISMAGSVGRDIGLPMAWPLVCAFTHAMNGNREAVRNILHAITLYRQSYFEQMEKIGQKDCPTMLRKAIAGCGLFMMHCYYGMKANFEMLPFQEAAMESQRSMIADTCGLVALKFMEIGYLDEEPIVSMSLEEVEQKIDEIVHEEIFKFLHKCTPATSSARDSFLLFVETSHSRQPTVSAMSAARRSSSRASMSSLISV